MQQQKQLEERRFSIGSSSSSGVDSCYTPLQVYPVVPPAAVDPDAAAGGAAGGPTPGDPDAGASPVVLARRTLPKLVVGSGSVRPAASRSPSPSPTAGQQPIHTTAAVAAAAGSRPQGQQHQPGHHSGAAGHAGCAHAGGWPMQAAGGVPLPLSQHPLLDPEHLICNGMGGAFLHPTHVFSYSRFACLDDDAAAATAAIYASGRGCVYVCVCAVLCVIVCACIGV